MVSFSGTPSHLLDLSVDEALAPNPLNDGNHVEGELAASTDGVAHTVQEVVDEDRVHDKGSVLEHGPIITKVVPKDSLEGAVVCQLIENLSDGLLSKFEVIGIAIDHTSLDHEGRKPLGHELDAHEAYCGLANVSQELVVLPDGSLFLREGSEKRLDRRFLPAPHGNLDARERGPILEVLVDDIQAVLVLLLVVNQNNGVVVVSDVLPLKLALRYLVEQETDSRIVL